MEFCPGCGKKSTGICNDCKPNREIRAKDILIKICSTCKKVFSNNKWTATNNIKKSMIKIAKLAIKETDDYSIKLLLNDFKTNPGIKMEFEFQLDFENEQIILPAKLEVTYCNNCAKQQGDYFEGTLQLRKIDTVIEKFIRRYIFNNGIFISDEKKINQGVDFKITDQRKIQKLGQVLQKKFGGVLKISPQVFSQDRQTCKNIYRVNIYYEAPDYKTNDVIKVENKLIHILDIKKIITGIDLKTNNSTNIDLKNKDYQILKPLKTTISRVHPKIEVLHPETFQSIIVQNEKKVKIGEKVKIIDDQGLFYII